MTSTNDITAALHTHSRLCWWNPDRTAWICPGTSAEQLPSATEPPLVDVRDMIVVHTALLREIRLAPVAVALVAPGDTKQARAVDDHLGLVCDLLHHHHAGEDELLWPKLRDRVPAAALEQLDIAEAQHEGIDAALQRVTSARAAWVGPADEPARDALAEELTTLHALLAEHLDFEERALLPRAACLLTEAEWLAVGEAAASAMPKPTLALAFGMFAYEGDPEVLRTMLQAAPAVPRLLLPKLAPRLYARRARRIYGTARP